MYRRGRRSAERSARAWFDGQPTWPLRRRILLFAPLALTYVLGVALVFRLHPPQFGGENHFVLLADGWLHGHLSLEHAPADTGDYTWYQGRWYVAFPPLPAVLLLPIVAVFNPVNQVRLGLLFSVGLGVVNIWLMLRVLLRFRRENGAALSSPAVVWLLVFFALGTETLNVTMDGRVWFLAHVVATTFLLLHLGEAFGARRGWLAGLWLGLAALARATTLFALPLFVLLVVARERGTRGAMARQLGGFGAALALSVAGMLLYNQARFGSPTDFGYAAMLVQGSADLHTYGQFSPHFLPRNAWHMGVQPPTVLHGFPYLAFDPFGVGILWTMPALAFAFFAFRRRERRWLAGALLAGCLPPISLLLLYFNTGWVQFGNRFFMDVLPLAVLLAALGMRPKPGWAEKLLILLSVLVNIWGGYVLYTQLVT